MSLKSTSTIAAGLMALILALSACIKDQVNVANYFYSDEEFAVLSESLNLSNTPINYQVILPHHMVTRGVVAPIINSHKATLGRVLFYDTKLSQNKTVSCASCHKQELAFSDDKAFSEGFNGQHTRRNSLPLAAAANFSSSYGGGNNFSSFSEKVFFFWDERAVNIMEQSRATIQDDIEMGMPLDQLASRLKGEPYYQILFRKAYGNSEITPDKILESIQEFLNAFVSVESRFDEGLSGADDPSINFPNYTDKENTGKRLFMENCASCHTADMSTAVENMANNGLDLNYTDRGRGAITNAAEDEGMFKVPFLRNVALTGPYMHDGRFTTLYDVVEHYNSGIKDHSNLDFRLRDPFTLDSPKRLNLSEYQKEAIVAFLGTLTDTNFVTDSRFSDPFKK